MSKRTKPRVFLALTALIAGALGELLSSTLFGYGASVDGVIALQALFIGLFLLGFCITLGEIRPDWGSTQSPSVPMPRSPNTETPSAGVEGPQANVNRNSVDSLSALLGTAMIVVVFLMWVGVMYASYGLLSVFPEDTVDYAVDLLTSTSFVAGAFLIGIATCLRAGMGSHHTMVRVSSLLLILTVLLWAFAQRTAYVILLEYLGYIEIPDHIALAGLSSRNLLAVSAIGALANGFVMYYFRPKGLGTAEPTQNPV